MSIPPRMPSTFAMAVSSGSESAAAATLGTTSSRTGLPPQARMASICSVTFIEPISAAIPEPARAATMKPASTGPNSRNMPSATNCPTYCSMPNRFSVMPVCCTRAMPKQSPSTATMPVERAPISAISRTVGRTA